MLTILLHQNHVMHHMVKDIEEVMRLTIVL